MKYKAKDIAKELGLSPATVSLVLNNKPGVSEDCRQRVLKKVQELSCEYLLKSEETEHENIGFVVVKTKGSIINEFPFFSYLIENIDRTVRNNGYNLSIMYLDGNAPKEEQLQSLKSANCCAYIVYAVEMRNEELDVFEKLDSYCVFLDNSFSGIPVNVVAIDNHMGVYQALRYLKDCGHKRIGYIRSKVKIVSFQERFLSFQQICRQLDLEFQEKDIIDVGYLEHETMADVKQYLEKRSDLPTAFFADNDLLSCRATSVMKNMGYRVPEDISMIGFDDRPICGFTDPPVTTIAIPRDDMGRLAVELLLSQIQKKQGTTCRVFIATKLVERKSVAIHA